MSKYRFLLRIAFYNIVAILLLLCIPFSCYDTNSFEKVRKLKTGMSIEQVEAIMGRPNSYYRRNDSTEKRNYTYDLPSNGMDIYIYVIYENEKVKEINTF